MPKYYDPPENWGSRGKIKITWYPFWRNWRIIREVIPYHVGDRVRFSIHTEKPNVPSLFFVHHFIYEVFPGDHVRALLFDNPDTEIPVSMITRTGDVEYRIGLEKRQWDAKTIFTTTVESWDTVRNKWFLLVAGAVITLLVGILLWGLGFIQLIPFWKIWIP